MLAVAEKLRGITHPLVSSMHMKKDFHGRDMEDVLVIETAFDADEDFETFDAYLMDLLLDLEDLKNKAEQCVGNVDRVDIRSH